MPEPILFLIADLPCCVTQTPPAAYRKRLFAEEMKSKSKTRVFIIPHGEICRPDVVIQIKKDAFPVGRYILPEIEEGRLSRRYERGVQGFNCHLIIQDAVIGAVQTSISFSDNLFWIDFPPQFLNSLVGRNRMKAYPKGLGYAVGRFSEPREIQ